MKSLNSGWLSETEDADQGGSDFIDSLPEPKIKTIEDLIAAATPATPAAPAPKPTDAMLRGKEMSQIQFDGMEPVYEPDRRGEKGAFLGYKFPYSQVQEPGMTASYSAPVYKTAPGRGGGQILVDPGGKFLGYSYPENTGKIEVPKPDSILAYENQFGTTMEPIYATRTRDTRGGQTQIEYGPPIGYRFDNGKSQYVNFDASGTYQNTQTRESGGFTNFALTVLSLAYPPAAPFIQAYRAIEAIDKGDTLGFVLNAAGAGRSIPGLDASTVKLLNDVQAGAKIITAVKTGDPLTIANSMVTLPGVSADVKDTINLVKTAKDVSNGDINSLLKFAQNSGSKVSNTQTGVTVDGVTYDINNTPAGNLFDKNDKPLTPEASMGRTFDDQIFNDLIKIHNEERAPQDQINTSDQVLTNAGLVSDNSVDTVASVDNTGGTDNTIAAFTPSQIGALNDSSAGDVAGVLKMPDGTYRDQFNNVVDERGNPIEGQPFRVDVAGGEPPPEGENTDISGTNNTKTIDQVLTDAGLVSDDDTDDQAAADKTAAEAALDQFAVQEGFSDYAKYQEFGGDVNEFNAAKAGFPDYDTYQKFGGDLASYQGFPDYETYQQYGGGLNDYINDKNTATKAGFPDYNTYLEYKGNVANYNNDVEAIAAGYENAADREQAAREKIRATEKTIEDTLTDAGLVSNTDNVQSLDSVEVSEKGQSQDKITDKTIEDELTDAGLVSNTNGAQKLDSVEVSGKALSTDNIKALTTDVIDALINAGLNALTTSDINALDAVTVLGTKDLKALNTDDISSLTTTDIDTLINAGLDSLNAVTVLGTKDVKSINTDYIDTLTSSNIAALTTDDIDALAQVTVLGTKDLKTLNTDYIDAFTSSNIAALTTDDINALDKVTVRGTKDINALTTADVDALDKVTILGTKDVAALTTEAVKTLPKLPIAPVKPVTPTKPVIPAVPAKVATPAEQLYQTTTQSNPTTLSDIKYYLDMTGADILPPKNKHDPLESLLNQSPQPMSLDELLRYLRS
jgi:hypothetical protein